MIHGGDKGVAAGGIRVAQTGADGLVDKEDVEIIGPCEVVDDIKIEVSLEAEGQLLEVAHLRGGTRATVEPYDCGMLFYFPTGILHLFGEGGVAFAHREVA